MNTTKSATTQRRSKTPIMAFRRTLAHACVLALILTTGVSTASAAPSGNFTPRKNDCQQQATYDNATGGRYVNAVCAFDITVAANQVALYQVQSATALLVGEKTPRACTRTLLWQEAGNRNSGIFNLATPSKVQQLREPGRYRLMFEPNCLNILFTVKGSTLQGAKITIAVSAYTVAA